MFNFNVDNIYNLIRSNWYRRTTIVLLLILSTIILLYFFSEVSLESISLGEYSLVILLLVALFAFWRVTTKLPRCPKRRIGLAVAIISETERQHKRITSDFVHTLKELLQGQSSSARFHVVVFPQYYSRKIIDLENAESHLTSARCHFLVYGRARIRRIEGKDQHILDIRGLVRHAPISDELQRTFSAEFSELLPTRLYLSTENDILSFEITSELVNIVSRYIIGIASLLSRDYEFSLGLFNDLKKRLSSHTESTPSVVKIRQRLRLRLADVYIMKCFSAYHIWRQTHDESILEDIGQYLRELNKLVPSNEHANPLC